MYSVFLKLTGALFDAPLLVLSVTKLGRTTMREHHPVVRFIQDRMVRSHVPSTDDQSVLPIAVPRRP